MEYTVEVYKTDRRKKEGVRLVLKKDYTSVTSQEVLKLVSKDYPADKYRINIYETMVTRVNAMTGKEFKERYDTPFSCSPRSENYWSM